MWEVVGFICMDDWFYDLLEVVIVGRGGWVDC